MNYTEPSQGPVTSDALTIADAKEKYDLWHTSIAANGSEDTSDAPWHRMAKRHLGKIEGRRVLEIGCGRGGFSKYLLSHGAHLVAADFSDSAIAVTELLLGGTPNFQSRVADIQDIPFPDESFDIVVSLETLEHVPDPDKGLSELVRVTKKGGKIIVTTPNYFGLLGLARCYRTITGRPWSEEGQPINQPIKLKDRVRTLKRLGCRVVAVDGIGHTLPVPRTQGLPLRALDQWRGIFKWFAAHSMTVAIRR